MNETPIKAGRPDLLGTTSRWTAAVRARESVRQDRLFSDPWAAALAGDEGEAWVAARPPESIALMVIRTRFFDDFLLSANLQGAIRQVVLVAAGLDTRAFRLGWAPGTRLFELDQPPILAYKDQCLSTAGAQPACAREAVGVDLTAEWRPALLAAGFDPNQPACWLLEGFLFYLPTATVTSILEEVTSLAAPGSQLGFDIVNGATLTSPWTRQWVEMQARLGAPWVGTMDDPGQFLGRLGWEASVTQPGQPDANFGRWPYPALPGMSALPRQWLVIARFAGRAGRSANS